MKKTEIDHVQISEGSNVTVTQMGHLVEVQHMAKTNRVCHIQKLDADRYVDKATGEIRDFKRIENRSQSFNSLRQTFKKLRYLINNNFVGAKNELFLTLTYRGDLQTNDHLRIGKDYEKFLKRLKYHYKDQTTIDAIRVIEPHATGNWHLHVLLRFNDLQSIYIPNETLRDDIWGNGWVTIKSLKDVDNIGAYVSAYLTDVEVTEENIIGLVSKEFEFKQADDKWYAKGARLAFYPPGMNIYAKTKGIKYPERKEMSYASAKKIVGAATPHYKKSLSISDEEKDFYNVITYEQYNMKRKHIDVEI